MSGGQFGIVNKEAITSSLNDAIVCYEIFKFINNNEGMRFKNIKEYIFGKYGEENLDYSNFKAFCKGQFNDPQNYYYSTKSSNESLIPVDAVYSFFEMYSSRTIEEIKTEITNDFMGYSSVRDSINKNSREVAQKYIDLGINKKYYIMGVALAYYCKINQINDKEDVLNRIIEFFFNEYDKELVMLLKDKEISKGFLYDSTETLCIDETSKEILHLIGCNNINDLIANTSKIESFCPLATILYSKEKYMDIVRNMSSINAEYLENRILEIYNKIKDSHKPVFEYMYNLNDKFSTEPTLQTTGDEFGLTRERIRQILAKVESKLKLKMEDIIDAFKDTLFSNNITSDYVTYEELESAGINPFVLNIFAYAFFKIDSEIKFDYDYKLYYFKNITTINNIIDERLAVIEKVALSEEDLNNLNDELDKLVVKYNYRFNSGIYVRNGLGKYDLLCKLVDQLFPQGYRIESDDFNVLNSKLHDMFGDNELLNSDRTFYAALPRYGYCLIDNGTYKRKEYCAVLSDELVSSISDAILDGGEIVSYTYIFDKFRSELESIGVTNKYYLKGILDEKLDKEVFFPKREGIAVGEARYTISTILDNYIENSDGVFYLNDLKKVFPGTEDYRLIQRLFGNDKILQLSSTKYLKKNLVVQDDSVKEVLRTTIEEVFALTKEPIISVKKVYVRFKLYHPEKMEIMKYCDDYLSFYAITKYMLGDEYYFENKYVSKEKNDLMTAHRLMFNKIQSMDKFDLEELNRWADKIGCRRIDNYLRFMDEAVNEGFIQVGMKTMVRQSIFEEKVDPTTIKNINTVINVIIEKNGSIDTRNIRQYSIFPNVAYSWNKYLLAGYVKAYLFEEYTVENTDTACDTTDYIIKKGGN